MTNECQRPECIGKDGEGSLVKVQPHMDPQIAQTNNWAIFRANGWNFLNSNFGLWVVSVGMVSLCTCAYKYVESRWEVRGKINRINTEIQYREYRLWEALNPKTVSEVITIPTRCCKAMEWMNGKHQDEIELPYVFQEFENRSFVSLIIEKRNLCDNLADKARCVDMLYQYSAIYNFVKDMRLEEPTLDKHMENLLRLAKQLLESSGDLKFVFHSD